MKKVLVFKRQQRKSSRAAMVVIVWQLDLQLPIKSVSITTNVVSPITLIARSFRYNII